MRVRLNSGASTEMSIRLMASPVKTTRNYNSTRRQELARRNRTTMVRSATALFLERGFAATTMAGVAEASGGSVQNVYKVFNTKVGLAKAVFDHAIAGDDEA